MQVEETLTIHDIMRIFHISQVSVYRWVAEARQGKSQFPLPINGTKRKLLWNRNDILAFQNANSVQPSPQFESASQRSKRHAAACQSLAKLGVKIASK